MSYWWWLLVPAVIAWGLWNQVQSKRTRDAIREYLRANPGWHYGLDIVKTLDVSRMRIYIELAEMDGVEIESTEGEPSFPGSALMRRKYRSVVSAGTDP